MSRRRFAQGVGVVGAGLLAGCGRLPGQAQAPARMPRLGELWPFAPEHRVRELEAFHQRLRDLGYIQGQSLIIERRYAENEDARLPDLASELAQLPVDLIVTIGTPAVVAVKQVTSTIPAVFVQVGDPVGNGLVASLARPGGNVTGLTNISTDLQAKRLQLLHDALPGLQRVAVLLNPASPPTRRGLAEVSGAASILGLQLQILEVFRAEDFVDAFDIAVQQAAEAVFLLTDWLLAANMVRLAELAGSRRLPAIAESRAFPETGGFLSYGSNEIDQHRRAAIYVDKILKGTKPADLPVEQAREFEFVINLKTTRTLGLTIPEHVLLQATEVIE